MITILEPNVDFLDIMYEATSAIATVGLSRGSDAAARKRKSGGTDVFDVCGQDRSGDDGACICRKGEKIESAPGTSGEAYHDRIEQTGDPAEKENEKRGCEI